MTVAAASYQAHRAYLPGTDWAQIQDPARLGWSTAGLAAARAYAATIKTAAVMIVQNGLVVDEWGPTDHRFMCHSIRKSLLSALYGIYVERGKIDLTKTLADLGIDDKEGLSEREKLASVHDLLLARSGVYHPSGFESPNMIATREARGSHGPGTFWCYNNWDFNALGTIFEQLTGTGIFDAFLDEIARPIGMQDFRYDDSRKDGDYVQLEATVHGAYPFRMTARDLARFGLLYLRLGRWGERQIVPEAWVKASVLPYSDAGKNGAYGYLWWVTRSGIHYPGMIMPEGSYTARGVGGHVLLVVPSRELLVVHRVDTDIGESEVNSHQLGRLFGLILEAGPAG
jgi:CubicO group peptidase (beta-lactamase class C family)